MKKSARKFSLLLFIFIQAFLANGKVSQKDSVFAVWLNKKNSDSLRIRAMDDFIWMFYIESDLDSALYYAKIAKTAADKQKNVFVKGAALTTLGAIEQMKGDFMRSLNHYEEAEKLYLSINDLKGLSVCYNNLGNTYKYIGEFKKAIFYYSKGLKIDEKNNDKENVGVDLSNLSHLYFTLGDMAKAKDYIKQAIGILRKNKSKQYLAATLMNYGILLQNSGEMNEALIYLREAMNMQRENNELNDFSLTCVNIASVFENLGKTDSAQYYAAIALKNFEKTGEKVGKLRAQQGLISIYVSKKQYNEAIALGEKALKLAQEIGARIEIKDLSYKLYEVYLKQNKHLNAVKMLELHLASKDSLLNEENKNAMVNQQFKYEYEKKTIADSISNVKANELKDAQLKAKDLQLEQEAFQRYTLYAGLVLVLLFGGFIYNRFKVTQKQNKVIEEQKKILEEQRNLANEQKEIIQEKQKEITDSINYAKRIQLTLLAHDEFLKNNLKDHFIFFEPKDIVSGDFYYATKKDNRFYLAVCDSTGHGVPGAFMSLLNISFLNEAINEKNIKEPNLILNHVRERLIQNMGGGKDGMDAILVCFENGKITYAAANNKPLLIKDNVLAELEADKMPVGLGEKTDSFRLFEINETKNAMLYLYTDGYADQFGGLKGKKFKYKNLNNLLFEQHAKPLLEQQARLNLSFDEWKGGLEQIDDVCVMGIQLG